MRILIIPEDQECDRYIVKPVIEALFSHIRVPARIDVLPEPRLRGADQALEPGLLRTIIEGNPMVDLFLLIIDRDCNRMRNVERTRARITEHHGRLIGCVAHQEIEVWLLALYTKKMTSPFREIREHCDPKEHFAEPFLKELDADGPGGGRKRAMYAITGQWRSLCERCPELKQLQKDIENWARSKK